MGKKWINDWAPSSRIYQHVCANRKFWKHEALSSHFGVPLLWYKTCLIHFYICCCTQFSWCLLLFFPHRSHLPLVSVFFLFLNALCSGAPSWKDQLSLISPFDVFKKTFQCDVTQDSKEMQQLINLYQKRTKIQRHWCRATFLSSHLISSTLRLVLVLKARIMECYSRCPDSLQTIQLLRKRGPYTSGLNRKCHHIFTEVVQDTSGTHN